GKATLGLAGAYLLRAFSESGAIPALGGALATVLYSVMWLLAARRADAHKLIATIYGATAAAIVFPMFWETTVRLQVLAPGVTAVLLTSFAVAGAIAAWRASLVGIVWITAGVGAASALALMLATQHVLPFATCLLAIALALEVTACRDRWGNV